MCIDKMDKSLLINGKRKYCMHMYSYNIITVVAVVALVIGFQIFVLICISDFGGVRYLRTSREFLQRYFASTDYRKVY